MEEKILNAEQVVIQLASIDVKVIRIGKKQMTLSVFKQLKKESIIDPETGKICGTPWGIVCYHEGCINYAEHIHVIWQKENELRRDLLYFSDETITYNHAGGIGGIAKHPYPLKDGSRNIDRIINYQVSYEHLRRLNQLFIAV